MKIAPLPLGINALQIEHAWDDASQDLIECCSVMIGMIGHKFADSTIAHIVCIRPSHSATKITSTRRFSPRRRDLRTSRPPGATILRLCPCAGGSLPSNRGTLSSMTFCSMCCDTGCCRHCGGNGYQPAIEPREIKRRCGVCLGSGECVECRDLDPIIPAGLYARAVTWKAKIAWLVQSS